jgi:hypothetical protein
VVDVQEAVVGAAGEGAAAVKVNAIAGEHLSRVDTLTKLVYSVGP